MNDVPACSADQSPAIGPLVEIMARLRDRDQGCAWDLAQSFLTIAPYTIEEAYEVADACARDDMADLKDELGDLLLQVVFHSRMAEEAGHFALGDVIDGICAKMRRRHPHIFGSDDGDGDGGHLRWEHIKSEERRAKGAASALEGVAIGLPALLRAEKLQKRAARTGFDWPDPDGARDKVVEEIHEIDSAPASAVEEEFGDLLFAVVNWARKHGVDPEAALRGANGKFERRFRAMEQLAEGKFEQLDLNDQEQLWRRVKLEEQS